MRVFWLTLDLEQEDLWLFHNCIVETVKDPVALKQYSQNEEHSVLNKLIRFRTVVKNQVALSLDLGAGLKSFE